MSMVIIVWLKMLSQKQDHNNQLLNTSKWKPSKSETIQTWKGDSL